MTLREIVSAELTKKGYDKVTVQLYSSHLVSISKYFHPKELSDLTFEEVESYMDYLRDRKKLSPSTRNTAKHAFTFWFKDTLKKNWDFDALYVPREYKRDTVEIFNEDEILNLISKTDNLKNRMVICLAYGCGLDISELRFLKNTDVDLVRKKIRIRLARTKRTRDALLPNTLIEDIKLYIEEYKPSKWFINGKANASQIAQRSLQHIFNITFDKTGIRKGLTFRSLRYSYIKHLHKQGVTMLSILNELNLNPKGAYYAFSTIEEKTEPVVISPLDLVFSGNKPGEYNVNNLVKALDKVKNDDEKDYLLEATKCLQHGLGRAGVIMAWNAAIRNIHYKLLKHSLHALNASIQRHAPNAKPIKTVDDFAHIKESVVLNAAVDLVEFDKNEKDLLEKGCLELRNKCGHPGKYKPEEHRVASYIEDLIGIVFSK